MTMTSIRIYYANVILVGIDEQTAINSSKLTLQQSRCCIKCSRKHTHAHLEI